MSWLRCWRIRREIHRDVYGWLDAGSRFAGDHSVRVSVRNSGAINAFDDTPTLAMTITSGSGMLSAPRESRTLLARLDPRNWFRGHRAPPLSLAVRGNFAGRALAADDPHRYSLYTPELNLMAETEQTTASAPAIAYEYIWFGGQPVAQIETATNHVHYYFNDHLGTPILTADATGTVDWRVEREPFGARYTVRAGASRYQPLAFPGQEEDPSTDRSYNIFRWYRPGWGRYTQADPIPFERANRSYFYAGSNPLYDFDPRGLYAVHDNTRAYGIPDKQAFKNACIRNMRDRVRRKFPAGACNFVGASATCGCSCNGGRFAMDPIDVYLNGPIYYFSGDWSQMPHANDTSVVNAQTAIAHEWRAHIFPSLSAIDPIVSAVEGSTYGSEQDCEVACGALSQRVADAYHKKIVATQTAEENRYP